MQWHVTINYDRMGLLLRGSCLSQHAELKHSSVVLCELIHCVLMRLCVVL
jgi:hypothetical protein